MEILGVTFDAVLTFEINHTMNASLHLRGSVTRGVSAWTLLQRCLLNCILPLLEHLSHICGSAAESHKCCTLILGFQVLLSGCAEFSVWFGSCSDGSCSD